MMTREQAVEVAKSWLHTPYVLRGRVKQGGIDCATLLMEYFIEIGAAEREELPAYSQDWFLHTVDNRYLRGITKVAKMTAETVCIGKLDAKPGDVALFCHQKTREVYTHGAIIIDFPKVVHAINPEVSVADCTKHPLMGFKQVAIFSPWKEEA